MPLNPSLADRTRLHARHTRYECFRRPDGLFDIEGHLTDVKDHDYELLTGLRAAGVPVHDIWRGSSLHTTARSGMSRSRSTTCPIRAHATA